MIIYVSSRLFSSLPLCHVAMSWTKAWKQPEAAEAVARRKVASLPAQVALPGAASETLAAGGRN